MDRVSVEATRRLRRLLRNLIPVLQCSIAAGIAWFIAFHVIGHERPFFAPIAAVISLGVSLGERLRRSAELVVGVSVGILVGDLLISVIGSGTWQIALVVALAMSVAVLLDSGTVIAMQAGSSAVLIATLLPPGAVGGFDRFIDALVGGLVGLAVAALLPANPLAVVHQKGRVVLGVLADALRATAVAVSIGDPARAGAVLSSARDAQDTVEEFTTALAAGTEIAKISPLRWRRRADLDRYQKAAVRLDHALRNTRVLARRAQAALRDGERVPERLPILLEQLAGAVVLLRDELSAGRDPVQARAATRAVARLSAADLIGASGFSMRVVIAQLRSISVDLLQAGGLSRDEAVAVLPPLRSGRTDE
ncbi:MULTISPECIES: FUSC family protein [Actinoalloteichus]|uniref:Membrane protein n=1 Tax=Actinoalloteichus fjordicus TaxID=1612552 RepID=A0AAC9LHP0_9PSEU|nr:MULTISPECIES: FUSC family protein [Actinoalloteichus]APU17881.1 putative membrane protein [Actinoalloteichus fjordicus]APU23959.1 putative membrane protein [Actinoalloteichus sp. GBA129-24]